MSEQGQALFFEFQPLESGPRGGVAQLGERLLCKQEVVGSIPITSTRLAAVMEFPGTPFQGAAGQRCFAS